MLRNFALLIAASLAIFPNAVQASDVVSKTNDGANSRETYWTPERLRNARPLPLPVPTSSSREAPATTTTGPSVSGNGQPPTVNVAPNMQNRLFTTPRAVNPVSSVPTQPRAVGTAGAYFTSSRLVPLDADMFYPYVTVGKLFFTIPGEGDAICSAAVISPRVILTAGHCVHSGSGGSSGFYTNFLFVPAYRDGAAPYQSWSWNYVTATQTWTTGGGRVPNAADYGMIELEDNYVDGSLTRIGDVTGYLGYRTQGLIPNHATLLGYPGNLDNGEKMHQVTAGSFRSRSPNSADYGSDMEEGSSGGPWIENFGVRAVGQNSGTNSNPNQVIGVSSYGPTATEPRYEGSSILDSRFTDLFDRICSQRSRNC